MNRVIALFVALVILATPSCAWWQKHGEPVVQDGISCAETEAAAAAGSGSNAPIDVIQIADDLVTTIAGLVAAIGTGNLDAIWTALAPDVAKYGEPFVACVFHDLEGGSAAGSAVALTAEEDDPDADVKAFAHAMVVHRGWRFR